MRQGKPEAGNSRNSCISLLCSRLFLLLTQTLFIMLPTAGLPLWVSWTPVPPVSVAPQILLQRMFYTTAHCKQSPTNFLTYTRHAYFHFYLLLRQFTFVCLCLRTCPGDSYRICKVSWCSAYRNNGGHPSHLHSPSPTNLLLPSSAMLQYLLVLKHRQWKCNEN